MQAILRERNIFYIASPKYFRISEAIVSRGQPIGRKMGARFCYQETDLISGYQIELHAVCQGATIPSIILDLPKEAQTALHAVHSKLAVEIRIEKVLDEDVPLNKRGSNVRHLSKNGRVRSLHHSIFHRPFEGNVSDLAWGLGIGTQFVPTLFNIMTGLEWRISNHETIAATDAERWSFILYANEVPRNSMLLMEILERDMISNRIHF